MNEHEMRRRIIDEIKSHEPFINLDNLTVNGLLWSVKQTGLNLYVNIESEGTLHAGELTSFWPVRILGKRVRHWNVERWGEGYGDLLVAQTEEIEEA